MKYWILAKVLPSISEDFHKQSDFDELDDFSRDEVKEMDLVGLKLHINHASNLIAGEIKRQFDRSDGSKWVIALIDTSKNLGKLTVQLIESKIFALTDVSLGHNVVSTIDFKNSKLVIKKTAKEVSIVTKARRTCDTCKVWKIISNRELKIKLGKLYKIF